MKHLSQFFLAVLLLTLSAASWAEWKTINYSDGATYVGNTLNGARHGQGTYSYDNGNRYVGDWRNGLRHGQGVFTWSEGDSYSGNYKNDQRHGQGTFTYTTGAKEAGEWRDGEPWNAIEYDELGKVIGKWFNGIWTTSSDSTTTRIDLTVIPNVSGATLYIDDELYGKAPVTIILRSKGRRTIKVTKSGYKDYVATVNVTRNTTHYATLKAKKASSAIVYCLSKQSYGGKFINQITRSQCSSRFGQTYLTYADAKAALDLRNKASEVIIEYNGGTYTGEVSNGVPDGHGTWTREHRWGSSEKYVGEWKNGVYHGQGTMTYLWGDVYVGEFKDGEYHGQGTLNYNDGRRYIGEWKDDKKHGQGTYTYPDGRKYVGQFKSNMMHGQGTRTWPDGRKYVGEFRTHSTWNVTAYDKEGSVSAIYVEGVEQVPSSREPSIVYCYRSKDGYFYSSSYLKECAGSNLEVTKQEFDNRRIGSTTNVAGLTGYCYRTDDQYFYKPLSGKCSSSDRNITKQEYNNRRLSENTSTTLTAQSTTAPSSEEATSEPTQTADAWGWCLTKKKFNEAFINRVTRSTCAERSGDLFATYPAADAEEQKRRQGFTEVQVTVFTNVADAVLYVDGIRYPGYASYFNFSVPPGRHNFRLTKKGYEDLIVSRTVSESESRFDLDLKPISNNASSSSTATAEASTDTTEEVTPDQAPQTSEAEVVFWQSIKDSDDPDEYRTFIQAFPDSLFVPLAKVRLKKLTGTEEVVPSTIPELDYGRYYALVIGNNDYDDLGDLKTAINDADKVASVLEYDYGFEVDVLKNATRSEILKALSRYRQTISAQDNLLIYYAGHGNLDEAANEGYWLPVDADRKDQSNWLLTDRIVAQVRAMEAKHVMVVADSCFSGNLIRAIKIEQRTPDHLQRIVKKKSRTALTSGGLEPVMDSGGGGQHSVFARSLISLLEENTGVLDASQLFSQLRPKVMDNSLQTPEYGLIHQAGHDGGDFLFVRR